MGDPQPRRVEVRIVIEVARIAGMIVLALVQVTLMPVIGGIPVPLVLLGLLCWLLVRIEMQGTLARTTLALRLALYGGVALDFLTAMALGSHALALMLAILLAASVCGRLRVEMLVLAIPALAGATLVYEVVLALIYHSTTTALEWQPYAIAVLAPAIGLAVLVGMPLYLMLRWRLRS